MAEIVNLNRFRKAKARQRIERQAEANRIAFGRTKAEKQADEQRHQKAERDLDGKKGEE